MFTINAFFTRSIRPRSCFNTALSFESSCWASGKMARMVSCDVLPVSKCAIQSFAWSLLFRISHGVEGQHVRVLFSRPKGPLHSPSFLRPLHHRHHPSCCRGERREILLFCDWASSPGSKIGYYRPLLSSWTNICSTSVLSNSTVTFSTGYSGRFH